MRRRLRDADYDELSAYMDALRTVEFELRKLSEDRARVPVSLRKRAQEAAQEAQEAMRLPALARAEQALREIASDYERVPTKLRVEALQAADVAIEFLTDVQMIGPKPRWTPK